MKRKWMAALLAALTTITLGPFRPALALPDVAEGITSKCKITVSEGDAAVLTDKTMKTHWAPVAGRGVITIELPDQPAGGLSVSWFEEPEDFLISAKDKNGSECNRYARGSGFVKIKDYFELAPNVRKITIEVNSTKDAVSELSVFSQGALPASVQVWDDPVKKADFMVVSAHQDDELLWFSGAIPEYAVDRGKRTVVVYMANCGRLRRKEAMDGLWAMGVKNHPVFNNFVDKRSCDLQEGLDLWGGEDKVVGKLVENIRQYKPSVVLSHDLNGEYGHGGHRATAYAVQKAVEAAQDKDKYPDSAAKYGVWQVKKLYLHLYPDNQITMDWNQPLEAFGGKTGYEMACIGYAQHQSQQGFYQMQQGGQYDNTKFGLAYTSVGEDADKNDFFEHVRERGATSGSDEPGGDAGPRDDTDVALQSRGTPWLVYGMLGLLGAVVLAVAALWWTRRDTRLHTARSQAAVRRGDTRLARQNGRLRRPGQRRK